MRTCIKCHEQKPDVAFYPNKRNKSGFTGSCKACEIARSKRWNVAHPEERRLNRFRTKYGLTADAYADLVARQNGECANPACSRDIEHVDHDHRTGAVRGLLCFPCNVALGCVADDPGMLSGLIAYLLEYLTDD